MKRRVVVTGVGAIAASGRSADEVWSAVAEGRSALATLADWELEGGGRLAAGAIVGVESKDLVPDRKIHKFIRRTDLLGLFAAERSIEASGLLPHRDGLGDEAAAAFNDATGVYVGSGGVLYENQYEFFPLLSKAGGDLSAFGRELAASVHPMWLLRSLPNNVLCHVGIRHQFKGPNACVTNHCVSGPLALADAAAAIRDGAADRAVVVNHDAPIEPETVSHYRRLGLLHDETLRPFDRTRAGIVIGEGASAVVLESEGEAVSRGARVLGEYLGGGFASEAGGLVALRDDGEGVARAIRISLDEAGLRPADVGMIVAHGNGTRQSDASEARGIASIFGTAIPPVTAFKWAFGHLIAASGLLDAVLALVSLRRGTVPGIATLEELDPEFSYLPASAEARRPRSDVALVVGRGFGGTNSALLVRASADRGR